MQKINKGTIQKPQQCTWNARITINCQHVEVMALLNFLSYHNSNGTKWENQLVFKHYSHSNCCLQTMKGFTLYGQQHNMSMDYKSIKIILNINQIKAKQNPNIMHKILKKKSDTVSDQ